jgi:HSP20 family molecular chaperone IbpA
MSALTKTTKEGGNQLAQAELTRDKPSYVPRFDICETDDELMLCGDLPGVKLEDLDIRFENRELVIHGKVEPRNAQAQYSYQEYGIGDYHRSFTIGEAVDSSKIAASMRDGVLTIHLPKTEQVKPRRIKVQPE